MKLQEANSTFNLTDWLNSVVVGKYVIRNGIVYVQGSVTMSDMGLSEIPCQFGFVSGAFLCQRNQLLTLKGSPIDVGGNFACHSNKLRNLIGGPRIVKQSYFCSMNHLTSLIGGPRMVGGKFECYNNMFAEEPDHSFIKIGGEFTWM